MNSEEGGEDRKKTCEGSRNQELDQGRSCGDGGTVGLNKKRTTEMVGIRSGKVSMRREL